MMSADLGCACANMMVPRGFVTPWMASKGSELSCHSQKVLQYGGDGGCGKWQWKSLHYPFLLAIPALKGKWW